MTKGYSRNHSGRVGGCISVHIRVVDHGVGASVLESHGALSILDGFGSLPTVRLTERCTLLRMTCRWRAVTGCREE